MDMQCVYDNYEISGCWKIGDGPDSYIETCDDADAQFWTLYGHIDGQGVEAIGDFRSREDAEQVFFRITGQPFAGSYEACPRLRLMHAAPALLAACRMVIDRWERGDLAEAARACQAAVALATGGGTPAGCRPYSVLLLYPDYANDGGTETYYAFVEATDAIDAVAVAQRQAAAAQVVEIDDPTDFAPLLVTQGHHYGQPLFNK
jgi:hypothetical protein